VGGVMMEQVISSNICQVVKRQSAELYTEHPQVVDSKLLQACIKLNELPGIGVRWSCEGHYLKSDHHTVEITIVVTRDGMSILEGLFNYLKEQITPDPLLGRQNLILKCQDLFMFDHDEVWVPNWTLSYHLPKVPMEQMDVFYAAQQEYIEYLEKAINNVVPVETNRSETKEYSIRYDDELNITASFTPNVEEKCAFEFLEFFKEHACLDPMFGQLALSYHFENGAGWGCGHRLWLDRNHHLQCTAITTFIGSFDETPVPAFYPAAIDTIMSMVKEPIPLS
jgi:hypothetical protein